MLDDLEGWLVNHSLSLDRAADCMQRATDQLESDDLSRTDQCYTRRQIEMAIEYVTTAKAQMQRCMELLVRTCHALGVAVNASEGGS